MGLTRREAGGSIRKALLLNMVNTGRVGQWQTGMAWARHKNNPRQAWVGDQRTVSRGLGREKKPGTRAGIRKQEIRLGKLGNASYAD